MDWLMGFRSDSTTERHSALPSEPEKAALSAHTLDCRVPHSVPWRVPQSEYHWETPLVSPLVLHWDYTWEPYLDSPKDLQKERHLEQSLGPPMDSGMVIESGL